MLRIFRGLCVAYKITGIPIAMLIVMLQLSQGHSTRAVLYFLTWLLLCAIVFETIARRKFKRLLRIRDMDLELDFFIRIFQKLLKRQLYRSGQIIVKLQLVATYLHEGQLELVKDTLDSISDRFGNRKWEVAAQQSLYYYYGMYFSATRDLTNASTYAEKMKSVFDRSNMKEKARNVFARRYNELEAMMNFRRGDTKSLAAAEQVYLEAEAKAETVLGRITVKFNLARIYLSCNRLNEAKADFSFVAQYGKHLRIALLARQTLEQLSRGEVPAFPI